MSAHLYFKLQHVIEPVAKFAIRRTEATTGDRLISFPGCPLTGTELDSGEVAVAFPRSEDIRAVLINWLMYWGIPWRVLP
ncbi:hypothetical protein [Burkholderia singularis]|uniref:hypothetical protein n=1 Tax=Burkholderia singularis TaxID=1503053 RepID=UPI000B78619F|nr:hypothetical protein [Burkholderia singularis]